MISPPISELGFCGLATGAAMAGLRPIVDLSTGSFIYEAWPQVANEAANAYSMSGGQTRVPVVFHLFHGLRGGGAAQHSGSPQAMLWNVPGLEIVIPSSPRDVKGLLKTRRGHRQSDDLRRSHPAAGYPRRSAGERQADSLRCRRRETARRRRDADRDLVHRPGGASSRRTSSPKNASKSKSSIRARWCRSIWRRS